MQYTIILQRSTHLLEVFDDEEAEFYVANPDTDFPDLKSAVHAARLEAAKADSPNYTGLLRERGINVVGSVNILSENYEVIMVIEGHHKPMFWWQPELAKLA